MSIDPLNHPLPIVSPAEWEVMEVLWKSGPLAARDIHTALVPEKDWDIKTVRTLLSRLVEKKAIGYEQIGNSYLYRVEYTREQLVCGEVRNVVNRTLNGSVSALLAGFLHEEMLSDREIEQIRKLLDEKQMAPSKKEKSDDKK